MIFPSIKKTRKILLIALLSIVVLEGGSRIILYTTSDLTSLGALSKEAIDERIEKVNWFKDRYVYNPFFGLQQANEDFLRYEGEDVKLRVGIVGGSFARGVGRSLLRSFFEKDPNVPFDVNNVAVEILAVGSGKQPQQLIRTLLESDNFDLFISLEGYNEIFVSHDSCRPSHWPLITTYVDPNLRGRHHFYNDLIRGTLNSLYAFRESSGVSKLTLLATTQPLLAVVRGNWKKFKQEQQRNCKLDNKNSEDPLRTRLRDWKKFTQKHQRMAEGLGKPLYTIVQPQQYIPKSKPFSQEEVEIFSARSARNQVDMGNQYLRASNEFLKSFEGNKHVIDSRWIFQNVKKTMYSDANCHLNEMGYQAYSEKFIYPIISSELQSYSTE